MEAQDEGRPICQTGRFMKGVYKYRIVDWSMSFFPQQINAQTATPAVHFPV